MRITPLDVRKQEFRKAMRGLDPEEVYAFLATVADEYEAVLNDNKALRERLLELDDKVQEYRTMERTLRDTLLTAERVNAEAKENARREAGIIIKEAHIEAEKALRDIKTEAMKLHQQAQQLRSQRDSFLARMKVVAESHLSFIESAAQDFRREDEVSPGVSEEHLADRPVDREEMSETPTNLFDAAREVANASSPHPETPRRTAPPPSAPTADRTPSAAAPGAGAPYTPRASDGPDPITMIIDRMKRGQQEILAAGAGAPGYPDAPAPNRVEARESEAAPTTATMTRDAEADERSRQRSNDVTQEIRLDGIRRDTPGGRNPKL